MTTELASTNAADLAEQVAIAGDLAKLTPEQRMSYYGEVCRSMGLNPLTRPFEYIVLNDKLTLYARRDATDQLRKIYGVNISIVARETVEGVYVVTARGTTADGRSDESVGAVPLVKENGDWQTAQSGKRFFRGDGTFKPIGPEDRANAMMKAETKAKRRVTLSIVGLGWLDETELETIPSARRANVDQKTGELVGAGTSYTPPSQVIIQKPMPVAPSSDLIDLPEFAAAVKRLRDCERTTAGEPPTFTRAQAKDGAALEFEWIDSRRRLYTWITSKVDAAPGLEELDDASLIDLATATAGL